MDEYKDLYLDRLGHTAVSQVIIPVGRVWRGGVWMDEYKDLDLDRLGHTAVSQGEEGMLRAWTSLHKKNSASAPVCILKMMLFR